MNKLDLEIKKQIAKTDYKTTLPEVMARLNDMVSRMKISSNDFIDDESQYFADIHILQMDLAFLIKQKFIYEICEQLLTEKE